MEKKEPMQLSRGLKKIINEAISNLPEDKKMNEYAICEQVAAITERRYIGDPNDPDFDTKSTGTFDYQTGRMGIQTTKQILEKVELFMLTAARKTLN